MIRAALDYAFISCDEALVYQELEPSRHLRRISPHAKTTGEFLRSVDPAEAKLWLGTRDTTTTKRRLRLPVRYVSSVLQAYSSGEISRGKAAEFLMIDEDTLAGRFGEPFSDDDE